MSVQSITAALAVQGVTSSEKLLLIVLANYADHNMQCWPSHSRLAHDTCLSQRNILRIFASLEAKGYLTRKARYRKNVRTSDMISIHIGGDTTSPGVGTPRPHRGDTVSGGVGTPRRQGGDTMAYRTFIEPIKEPSLRDAPVLPLEGQPAISAEETRANRKALAEEARRALGIFPKGQRA